MMSPIIQLGAKVRRRNDIGMDTPGAVVRLKDAEVLVYWPDNNFYQELPVVELEPYGAISESIAA
jgi:hypothetical protein